MIVHANGHRFHIPVVPPAKKNFVAACANCQADETPAPAPQPIYGEVKEMRGFVMRLDPGCAQFLQTLKPINLDLNAKPGTVPTTTPMFVSGTVFYTPHMPEGMGELLKEGMPVQVRTCIPPHNFHGDTYVFDNMLQFRTITAVDGTASLYIVDPRPPEMVEGTPEYKARVGSIKYTP